MTAACVHTFFPLVCQLCSVQSHTVRSVPFIRLELNHLNGQLPNLDLFNSVVRIAGTGKFAISSMVYDVRDEEQVF